MKGNKKKKILGVRKGFRVERELLHLFEAHGFVGVRVAGSGNNSPDILVFKKGKQFALEIKAREGLSLHVKTKQMEMLKQWEKKTGITAFVVWKKKNKEPLFIPIQAFKKGKRGYNISFEEATGIAYSLIDLVYS